MRRRTYDRGFTLVELTVALAAGLLVGLAVVGLSKEATTTFHEETRAATAEMSLRAAADRLRADLLRAAYMSSPAIVGDPNLIGANTNGSNPIFTLSSQVVGVQRLAGLRLYDGGSMNTSALGTPAPTGMSGTDDGSIPFSANNGLKPDAIDITGNLNTTEIYFAERLQGQSSCTGDRMVFENYSPAVYRLRAMPGGIAAWTAELQREFLPVATRRFLARVHHTPTGKDQYAEVCAAGFILHTDGQQHPYVDLAAVGGATGGSGLLGVSGTGAIASAAELGAQWTVNPVLTVRWKIAPTVTPYTTQLTSPSDTVGTTPAKFDLYRVYVDSTNAEIAPTLFPPELVAEYAIDMKFAFTVDNTPNGNPGCTQPNCPPYAPVRTHSTLAFGDPANATTWAPDITGKAAPLNPGPQRIRSVRVRLATRTQLPDRNKLLSPTGVIPADYLYRYCLQNVAPTSCTTFARVRTVMTEVSLNNQSRAFYP